MSDVHYRLLVNNRNNLRQFLDPVSGVVDELVNAEVFSDTDSKRVYELADIDSMSGKIVDVLSRKADAAFDVFISALLKTGQQHVAYILGMDTGVPPMSQEHRDLLGIKTKQICQFLDPVSDVIDRLVDARVFNSRDAARVRSKETYTNMSHEVVAILARKADWTFDKFIEVLKSSGQEHVAYILTGEGEQPITDIRIAVLGIVRDQLVTRIDSDPSSLLVDKLIAARVISNIDNQQLQAQETCIETERCFT